MRHLVEVEGPGDGAPVGILVDAEVADQVGVRVGRAVGDLAGADSGVLGLGRGRAEDAEGEQEGKNPEAVEMHVGFS